MLRCDYLLSDEVVLEDLMTLDGKDKKKRFAHLARENG